MTLTDVDKFNNQTLGEEIANSITHGLGAIASIVGLVFLVIWGAIYGNIYSIVSGAIFGASLVILYLCSTLYHAITNIKAKKILRTFDHCSIFFLITGTYAPFCLVTLNGIVGWILFGFNLVLTVVGVVLNAINIKKFHKLSLVFYLLMGWSIVFASNSLLSNLNFSALSLLLIGGIFYTLGILFYIATKPKYMHMIWHIFVLFGSVTHYLCVLFYVIPVRV